MKVWFGTTASPNECASMRLKYDAANRYVLRLRNTPFELGRVISEWGNYPHAFLVMCVSI